MMNLTPELQAKIDEINEASKEIPFGNSAFQNINFVLKAEITPARALRHCMLRLNDRLSALRETYYSLQLEQIDIEEMQEKIESDDTDKFEKRRLVVKLEQKMANRVTTEKMISDCMEEINTLYSAFKSLPKVTRAEFEAEEEKHFQLKLAKDATLAMSTGGAAGALGSLDDMGSSQWFFSVLQQKDTLQNEIDKYRNEKLALE